MGTGAAFGLFAPGAALAAARSTVGTLPDTRTSALRFDGVVRNFNFRLEDRWGWTSAVSMIFAYYGYRVSQRAIVEKAYDGSFDLSGDDFTQNAQLLNRPWLDETGKAFESQIKPLFAVTPYAEGVAEAEMVAALGRNQPVLLCDSKHAMVLTELTYENGPGTPRITRAVVADTWPDKRRFYALDPRGITAPPAGRLNYAAVVQVYATGTGTPMGR